MNSTFLFSVHRSFVPFRIDLHHIDQTKTKFMLKTEMHQFAWPVILCSADSIFTWVCECVFLSVSSIIWLDDWLTDWAGALDHLQKPVTAHMYPMLHERAHFRITLLLVSSIFLVAFSCSVSDFTLINVWTPNLQQAKGYTYFMHKNIVNICIEISWNCFFFASFRDNCIPLCQYSI